MSKGNVFETDLLDLIFTATAIANIADNASASPLTSLYISLHTTPGPGEAGNQQTNEATYTGYARVAVGRTGSGWTVASGACENAGAIDYAECTGGTNTITDFGIGTLTSGTGKILYKGALTSSLAVSTGITPSFAAGDLDVTED